MKKYHKINSIFKRDQRGRFTEEWSMPEFEYLQHNAWSFEEKVDGTNIRIGFDSEAASPISVGGRTDMAQIPVPLYQVIQQLITREKFIKVFGGNASVTTLYGEGYGNKIQRGGGNYISDGVSFVLFDVLIDGWWMQREDVTKFATLLEIKRTPVIKWGSIKDAINIVSRGDLKSRWGDFMAEGLVLRPHVPLFTRQGDRVITKVKCKDFWR